MTVMTPFYDRNDAPFAFFSSNFPLNLMEIHQPNARHLDLIEMSCSTVADTTNSTPTNVVHPGICNNSKREIKIS